MYAIEDDNPFEFITHKEMIPCDKDISSLFEF